MPFACNPYLTLKERAGYLGNKIILKFWTIWAKSIPGG